MIPIFDRMFSLNDKLKCISAQQNVAAKIINKAISACTERTFKFDDKKLFLFLTSSQPNSAIFTLTKRK